MAIKIFVNKFKWASKWHKIQLENYKFEKETQDTNIFSHSSFVTPFIQFVFYFNFQKLNLVRFISPFKIVIFITM